MAFRSTLACMSLLIVGCSAPDDRSTTSPTPSGKWADDRLWAVLQAQDHRDTPALCALLGDTSATVREAAAMALASVQDSASMLRLVPALTDASPAVRRAAAFALSFSTDSVLLAQLDARTESEPDSSTRLHVTHAAFRAAVAGKRDALFLLSYLESEDVAIRTRAAAMLARRPKEELAPLEHGVSHAISVERAPDVRAFLVLALKHTTDEAILVDVKRYASSDSSAAMRVNALRALGKDADAAFLLERTTDAVAAVRQTAIERLHQLPAVDGQLLWDVAQRRPDPNTAIPLYGLVMQHGDAGTRNVCGALLAGMAQQDLGPYLNAELLKARYGADRQALDTLLSVVGGNGPAVLRMAAFETWLSVDGLDEKLLADQGQAHYGPFYRAVLATNDAGLIAAACERMEKEPLSVLKVVLNDSIVTRLRTVLHPLRDLETLQLLDGLLSKRDGRPAPAHAGPPFNHPIDRAKLLAIQQGQQYRITTTKGEIVLALEPDAAPGSCVAFDSLVTAGYYDGKYFHRVVPNFVAQGGCPRGDGYGGMPWTLRTEIGYDGFTTGAVGLASAGRDTESCQFFITLMPAPHLDGRYTRFAHVVSGMAVAQRLVVGDRMTRVERLR